MSRTLVSSAVQWCLKQGIDRHRLLPITERMATADRRRQTDEDPCRRAVGLFEDKANFGAKQSPA